MNCHEKFLVPPGSKVQLEKVDADYTGKHESHEKAKPDIAKHVQRMGELQYLLYANASRSLLIVLQALDAGGKDGTIRHLFSGMNPQGTSVYGFKQPSAAEAAHDFLWRAHQRTPAQGEIVIFNRSHYEDVLVTRVHGLVPEKVWSRRYDSINAFERVLALHGTRVLKFFLHITPEEQLARFRQRLEDPSRQWKISNSDYTEREFWPEYLAAYEDVLERTSTKHAPWFVIPSNKKWYRDLAISQIVVDELADMGLEIPPVRVDLEDIVAKYHAAEAKSAPGV